MFKFIFNEDHRLILGGALALTTVAAGYSSYRLWISKRDKDGFYETSTSLNEYLLLHYGSPSESVMFRFGPIDALDFPKRCAELCLKHLHDDEAWDQEEVPMRVLDVGCAVGRSTFELTRMFSEVVGVDLSNNFISTCEKLKRHGTVLYSMTTEGLLKQKLVAAVDPTLNRNIVTFRVADACYLPADVGVFGCVLAANLICRLPRPDMFLLRCASLVAKGGLLVITSPYTFMPECTAKRNMLGGFMRNGRQVTGFDGLQTILGPFFELIAQEEMPFLIRETKRKHQWSVAHATVWRRK